MKGFNLSAWAITHRPFVYYVMAMLVVIGIASYMRLGRNEDPTFTIKAMVVQTQWPGATLDDTVLQITERIERKLQETPHLDYLKSYTRPGQSTIFVYLKGSTGPKAVSDAWYQVRKKIKDIELTLPPGVIGPVADDEFGDTYGIVYGFTADGFTHRELRDYVEKIRDRLLQVPDVNKVNLIGEQPERIYIEFSPAKLAGYGLNPAALAAVLQAQNAVAPSGVITTEEESLKLRVSGCLQVRKGHPRHQFHCRRPDRAAGRHRGGQAGIRRPAGPDLPRQRQARRWAWRFPCATEAMSSRWAGTSSRPCRS